MKFRPSLFLVVALVAGLMATIVAADPLVVGIKVLSSNPAATRILRARGARVLVDYGSFQLLESREPAQALAAIDGAAIRADLDHIQLNTGIVETRNAAAQSLRRPVNAFVGKRLHLVQFVGPIQPKWHAALRSSGVEIVSYIPQNAYLVYGDAAALQRMQGLSELSSVLQWDGSYLDDYKIQPAARLLDASGKRQQQVSDLFTIQLYIDEATNTATKALIDGLRTRETVSDSRVLHYRNLIVPLNIEDLPKISVRPDVVSIHPFVLPKKRDERQAQIVAGNLTGNGPSGPGYLAWLTAHGFTQAAFSTSGFVVDVSDSGIDNGTLQPNHFGLYELGVPGGSSRVAYNRIEGNIQPGNSMQAIDGHGNINAHIIAGYNDLAYLPHVDASGYHFGLGIAPFVTVGSSVIFAPDKYTFASPRDILWDAYLDGARISSNSWGASMRGAYDSSAQDYDRYVRDVHPSPYNGAAPPKQEMVVVFSAGNDGPSIGTIGSPGVAKNVITVGAAESVLAVGGTDGCGFGDSSSNNANDIIDFSSRGPCTDGRNKPDIVAPGTRITGGVWQAANPLSPLPGVTGTADPAFRGYEVCGGVSSVFFPSLGQEYYTTSSGTSHSCPAVSGAAALIRQDFINKGQVPPSPAMTKAVLAGTARYMNGSGAGGKLPSASQGMGMINLGTMFDGTPRFLRDELAADKFTASGQTRSFNLVVRDPSKPVRIALAWTDAPGSTVGNAYLNDLNLQVVVGTNTYLGNVFSGATSTTGGVADAKNNLECVFLPAGTTGTVVVTVTAANINSDGVPGDADLLDQDFALYAYNVSAAGSPAIEAAGYAIVSEGFAPANSRVDDGENVSVSITLKNVGATSTSNLAATLQNTGGVTNGNGVQVYGSIVPGGTAAQTFTFTGAATATGAMIATFNLTDGGIPIGTAAVWLPGARQAKPIANGAILVSESFSPANNRIEAGEIVTLNLSVKNVGDLPLTNAVGSIPGFAPLNFGTIAPGASVAMPITFTAPYPADMMLVYKMQLQDDSGDHGTLLFNQARVAKPPLAIVDSVTLTSESAAPPNNRPDYGELVTAAVTLRNVGESHYQDLEVEINPFSMLDVLPASTYLSFGPVPTGGTATRSYTFVGGATCGNFVSAMLLTSNNFFPSPNYPTIRWLVGGRIFMNQTGLNIPGRGGSGPASLFPSPIQVSGLSGTISKLRVTLDGIQHTFPADLDFVLVGPGGQKVMLMSDCGADSNAKVTYTFDDSALPIATGPFVGSGTVHPTDLNPGNSSLPPLGTPAAPPPPYGNALSVFNGTSPNGIWYLYAYDHSSGDVGSLDGWELVIATNADTCPDTATDLVTTITGIPASVQAGQTITATVKVANNSANVATESHLVVTLPAGHTLVSAVPSQGSLTYTYYNYTLDAPFGLIPAHGSAQLVIQFIPNVTGAKTVQGVVQVFQNETNSGNNTATVNFTATANVDSDGDGMPDVFETANGFDPHNAADASADADGDGLTNLQEFRAGTDPHDPSSGLRIVSFTKFGTPTLTFQSQTGKTYRIERTDSVDSGVWTPLFSNFPGIGGPYQFTDYGAPNSPQLFYRVVLTP